MDLATDEQWRRLGDEQRSIPVSGRVMAAVAQLEPLQLGFPVSQLEHALQVATRAQRAGADPQLVVAGLCHDIGRLVPGGDHAAISAALLRPYVRPEVAAMVRAHSAFQLRYTHHYLQGARADARRRYRRRSWYPLAARFVDEWDSQSFDPAYDTLPLEHFAPLLREVFDAPRPAADRGLSARARAQAGRVRIALGI